MRRPVRPPHNERPSPSPSRQRKGPPHPDGDSCIHWELRFRIALHAGYYLTIRIVQPHLRERVIEHLAVGWLRWCDIAEPAGSFATFFERYMADVERDLDPKTADLDWEYHRVWTNHASLLGGELREVHPRAVR